VGVVCGGGMRRIWAFSSYLSRFKGAAISRGVEVGGLGGVSVEFRVNKLDAGVQFVWMSCWGM
jgi:hypothetical protein